MSLVGTTAITELWATIKARFGRALGASATANAASVELLNDAGETLDSTAIAAATTSAAGVMSSTDKAALDRLDAAVKTGAGVTVYGSEQDSGGVYHRYVFTELGNIRHDTSLNGTTWSTYGYFVKEHRPGDTMAVNINTAGFVTSSTTSVRISVPLDKPCPSGMTVSVFAKGSWTIRSIGGYSHGSNSSSGATPSTVTATLRSGWIDLAATMSSTAGGTNNTPVGVSVTGLTILFSAS